MTDGRSEPANYNALLNIMQRDQVTLSTIGLGQDADVQLLQYLAIRGKGRFYYTNNANDLPHIFAEEARLSAGSPREVMRPVPKELLLLKFRPELVLSKTPPLNVLLPKR